MAGKRVAPSESGGSGAGTLAATIIGAVAATALALGVGLGIYASGYTGVFPGVTVGDIPLDRLGLESARATLESTLPARLDQDGVTIYADSQELGTYGVSQLGGYADSTETAQAAYGVGREPGIGGWLKNGWTMGMGLVGGRYIIQPDIQYDQEKLATAVAEIAQDFDQTCINGSYELTQDGLYATKHQDGRELNQELLIEQLQDPGDTIEAGWKVIPAQPLDLEAMAASLQSEASPARYDAETGTIVEGQVGVALDTEAAAFALEAAAGGETILLPADVTFPELTAQELESVLFRDLLATATTAVSGTSVRKNNVRLAAEAVNGTVLNSGDIFHYNEVVGERTTDRGYGLAGTYINGQTVDTVGGGICQVSSTVYLASMLADLEIVERYNHAFWPGYVDLGMDATVSWGGPEFRFRNSSDYPVRIEAVYENDELTVRIYGTNTTGTYVTMTREVLSTTGYETEYVETEELPWGTEKEQQNGYTGREVNTYRNRYSADGKLISSDFEARSVYKSRNKIILVGVKGKPSYTPPPETETGGNTGGSTDEPSLPPDETGDESSIPGWLLP